MEKLSVYKQLTDTPGTVFEVLKREIGMKTNCMPFAVKLIEALKTLSMKNEQEEFRAANILLSGMQTLAQGGIIPEDYDKIDFVKRGGTIVPSARVEAFYRAAARKGYRIFDDIVAVPVDDSATTYFKENFYNGDIVYTLEDARKNLDRAITAERLIQGYFDRFLCRLSIREKSTNKIVAMTICEMPNAEMLAVSAASEQGIYKAKWEQYTDNYGHIKKRKVISEELNSGTFWINWTGEMVKKTIIRRALKRVKEVLPDLKDTIYAFEQDEYTEDLQNVNADNKLKLDIPVEKTDNVNLNSLTDEQKAECAEMYELCIKNPKLAEDAVMRIKEMFSKGMSLQEVINADYASIMVLRKSPSKWAEIGGYFVEESKNQAGNA